MSSLVKIKKAARILFSSGSAFKLPKNGDKLIDATAEGQKRAYDDVYSTLDSILPDNSNFTAQDATDWEIRLGLIVSEGVDLEVRKKAIIRKMNHPGDIAARQSADYLQDQLHDAGFDEMFVYENENDLNIAQILSISADNQMGIHQMGIHQMGDVYSFHTRFNRFQMGLSQMGTYQMGASYWEDCIINNIDVESDQYFHINDDKRTFVICGLTFGAFGNCDEGRIEEFRQLVLRTKPVGSVAILLLNYI